MLNKLIKKYRANSRSLQNIYFVVKLCGSDTVCTKLTPTPLSNTRNFSQGPYMLRYFAT